jgi:hypothetical protein
VKEDAFYPKESQEEEEEEEEGRKDQTPSVRDLTVHGWILKRILAKAS